MLRLTSILRVPLAAFRGGKRKGEKATGARKGKENERDKKEGQGPIKFGNRSTPTVAVS